MLFPRSKKVDVLSHWYSLVPSFNTSAKEFYQRIEKRLEERKVPGLEMSRVEFAEGSILSAKREYLRMRRERLVFDVCASPFGTAYFFSCRFAEIPSVIRWWHVVIILGLLAAFTITGLKLLGIVETVVVIAIVLITIFSLFRNVVALGFHDFDVFLIKDPVIGPIYERFLRKETYYREDTRLMYLDTVNAAVKALVEETTGAHGIKLIQFNEYSPILGELYKPSIVLLKPPQQS